MNIKDLLNPVLVWFLVGLVMFIFELATPGLVMIFFGVGAWVVALLTLLLKIPLNAQLLLFIVFSVLSLVLFRKWLTQTFHGFVTNKQDPAQDLEEFVGHRAIVKEDIHPGRIGKVEFKGTLWEAEAEEELSKETMVTIVKKNNMTLIVKKI